MEDIKYILQKPDGSQSEYDVKKFSDSGKETFVLLGEVRDLYQKLNKYNAILIKAELKMIDELQSECVEDNLLESKDGGKRKRKKQT
tara:strand:+ start:200 stop:460 length:261 start_codon:yes stop_codon:yes gene_type:complete